MNEFFVFPGRVAGDEELVTKLTIMLRVLRVEEPVVIIHVVRTREDFPAFRARYPAGDRNGFGIKLWRLVCRHNKHLFFLMSLKVFL